MSDEFDTGTGYDTTVIATKPWKLWIAFVVVVAIACFLAWHDLIRREEPLPPDPIPAPAPIKPEPVKPAPEPWRPWKPTPTPPIKPAVNTVAKVIDPITLEISDGSRVTLPGVSAPRRPHARTKAIEALEKLCVGKEITVSDDSITIEGGVDIVKEMIRLGHLRLTKSIQDGGSTDD